MTGSVSAAARSCRYRKVRLGTVAATYELRYVRYSATRQDGTNGGVDADDTAALVCTRNHWCDGTGYYWMADVRGWRASRRLRGLEDGYMANRARQEWRHARQGVRAGICANRPPFSETWRFEIKKNKSHQAHNSRDAVYP